VIKPSVKRQESEDSIAVLKDKKVKKAKKEKKKSLRKSIPDDNDLK
jgi:hypothetical protein